MAKSGSKLIAKKRKPGRTLKPRYQNMNPATTERVTNHVSMILDPCNAQLAPTAYRGSDGMLTRSKVITNGETSATDVAYIFAYHPSYNGIWSGGIADLNANMNPVWTVPGPGQAFYLNTADTMRTVGACVEFNYAGTELNRSGTLFRGVIPASSLTGVSVQTLMPLLQAEERVPDKEVGTLWVPAPADEEYWEVGSTAPDANGDRNVIVVLVLASASTPLSFRFSTTLIAEWRPKYGLGIQTPNPSTPDVPGGLERVKTALAKFGDWFVHGSHAQRNRSVAYGAVKGLMKLTLG